MGYSGISASGEFLTMQGTNKIWAIGQAPVASGTVVIVWGANTASAPTPDPVPMLFGAPGSQHLNELQQRAVTPVSGTLTAFVWRCSAPDTGNVITVEKNGLSIGTFVCDAISGIETFSESMAEGDELGLMGYGGSTIGLATFTALIEYE